MHFLLDTRILIGFIREARCEYLLNHLFGRGWYNTAHYTGCINNGMGTKKKLRPDEIKKAFSTASDYSEQGAVESQLKAEFDISKERAEKIEELLTKGIKIKTPPNLKIETIDRAKSHKAPFHGGKTKSINDALIYFSTKKD